MLVTDKAVRDEVCATAPDCYSARTTDVDAGRRVEYWSEAFGAVWGRVELAPAGTRAFYGDLQSVRIASLRINRMTFEGMAFKRLQAQPQEPFYSFANPQRGRSIVLLGRDRLELVPGAVYLLDNSCQHTELCAPESYQTLNVQIPVSRLRERLGSRWSRTSRKVESDSLVLDVLEALIRRLSHCGDAVDGRSAELLERQICDLIAFCLSGTNSSHSEERTILVAQRERADRCIERLYARPDLCPGQIAAACGVSEGYLHKFYRGTGRTVMERVRETRLNAARDLLQRMQVRITVSEVAYEVGFKSLAEFSRAYKQRFGHTPQSARKRRDS